MRDLFSPFMQNQWELHEKAEHREEQSSSSAHNYMSFERLVSNIWFYCCNLWPSQSKTWKKERQRKKRRRGKRMDGKKGGGEGLPFNFESSSSFLLSPLPCNIFWH